ncbi:MAG: hypothetical protein WA632_14105, partial [Gallionella sp.]
MVRIKAAPVKLPQRKRAARATVAVGKWMYGLEAVMQNRRSQNRGELLRLLVPPLQQLEYQPGNCIRWWRTLRPDPDVDHPVLSCFALIHY